MFTANDARAGGWREGKNIWKPRTGGGSEYFSAAAGPTRLRDVQDAQQKIVSIIRRLEDAGEIIIARAGEDELV